ncbi:MAG: hypothetical protein ACREFR_08500 [Limisphaerales bacterium]
MKSKRLLCVAVVLGMAVPCKCRAGEMAQDDATIGANEQAGHTYYDKTYGFQITVPPGWQASETSFSFEHYGYAFLTINNQRPGLEFEGGWGMGWLNDNHVTQLQSNEVYIAIGYGGGPMETIMRDDSVGDNLASFAATKNVHAYSFGGVLNYGLEFFKRGELWSISARMKEPVTEENREKVMALMRSIHFVDRPVENASWAESLAWNNLPGKVRETGDRFMGWPAVGDCGEQSGYAMAGPRSVLVTNLGSAYALKFDLQGVGEWSFTVKTSGHVESEPPALQATGPPPSQWPSDLPGAGGAIINSYWIAPDVQASVVSGKTTLTWFAKDGDIEQQAAVGELQPGFVDIPGGFLAIRGINENWQITLPREPSHPLLAGYITSTADSRVFVHVRHPKLGQIAVDIYIHGKRMNTVGPFWQYEANNVALNDDGSVAFLTVKANMQSDVPLRGDALREKLLSQEHVHAQIVALDRNGRIRFQTDCGPAVSSPIIAPDGAGVLLRPNAGTNQNTFIWFTAAGLQRSLAIRPNPEFIGWIPKTCQSLFSTSIGLQSGPYELVDWKTGKKLWRIPCPGRGEILAIALTPEIILFSVAEPYPSGTWHEINESLFQSGKEWVRTFYTVGVQDGKLIARWPGQFPHRYSGRLRDHFLQLGDKLYYVTGDEFSEINLDDILAKRNGWQ